MRAPGAVLLVSLFGLAAAAPARAQEEQRPPRMSNEGLVEDASAAERDATEAAPLPTIEGNIDYDVSYDETVARGYDDGYDPQAAAQFQDSLAPYGTWVDDDAYGRVWQPSADTVGADFSPYATGGHWSLTEYGWTWISEWDWGWAPFHYGRWLPLADRGWCWIPGTLWGPAWVSWRAGGGYVGWAPLPPRHMGIGSPLGPGSSWHFTTASSLWRGHPAMLSAQVVPRIFGRMTVVSNPRALPIAGARVRVNAGPSPASAPDESGGHAIARLASIAPRTLPRRAIEAHAGAPVAQRPWMQAGAVPATASGDRGIASADRDRVYIQRGGQTNSTRRAYMPPMAPPSGSGPRTQQGQAARPGYPSGVPSAIPGVRRSAPGIQAPTMNGTVLPFRAVPRTPVFRAPPSVAPRPWTGGTPVRVAPPTYSRPGTIPGPVPGTVPRSSGGPAYGGGRSSFNGGAPAGGGQSFSGGSSSGGVGGRAAGGQPSGGGQSPPGGGRTLGGAGRRR
jgi:hypothetical protein